jgi:hypothetical protein
VVILVHFSSIGMLYRWQSWMKWGLAESWWTAKLVKKGAENIGENIMIILCVAIYPAKFPLFHISRQFFCLHTILARDLCQAFVFICIIPNKTTT